MVCDYGMQTMTHRTTFALDEVTAQRLKRLATCWWRFAGRGCPAFGGASGEAPHHIAKRYRAAAGDRAAAPGES